MKQTKLIESERIAVAGHYFSFLGKTRLACPFFERHLPALFVFVASLLALMAQSVQAQNSYRLTRVEIVSKNVVVATLGPYYYSSYPLTQVRGSTQETDYYVNPYGFQVIAQARERDNTSSPWYVSHTNTYDLARLPYRWTVDQVARVGGKATIVVGNVATLGFGASIAMRTYPTSRLRATETLPTGALNPFANGTTADDLYVSADTLETRSAQGYINVRALGYGEKEWLVQYSLKGIADHSIQLQYVYVYTGPAASWTPFLDAATDQYHYWVNLGYYYEGLAYYYYYLYTAWSIYYSEIGLPAHSYYWAYRAYALYYYYHYSQQGDGNSATYWYNYYQYLAEYYYLLYS